MHESLDPQLYFEIGVDSGASLQLSECASVGVDPAYHITCSVTAPARLFRITSDKFFENEACCRDLLGAGIDLSFIDGMHLSEYVLRDFVNVEKWCNQGGAIVLDDVLPEQMEMAARERDFNAWCGDVFKIVPILAEYRPDLKVHVFEAFAGPYRKGLAFVTGLDRGNTALADAYERIEADILGEKYALAGMEDLERMVPTTPIERLEEVLQSARAAR